MPDPVDPFDHFDEGLPVTPLPAPEVRRRGDRLRRRNTVLATVGGVAAAVVFVGIPVAIVSGGDGGDNITPAPSPAPTKVEDVAWVATIPEDFPLTAGMPAAEGGEAPVVSETAGPALIVRCEGDAWVAADALDVASARHRKGPGDDVRTLAVYRSDEDAAAALDNIRAVVGACPEENTGLATFENRPVDASLGAADESYLFQTTGQHDDLSQTLQLNGIARSGNALYLTSWLDSGTDRLVETWVEQMRVESAPVLNAMCVFSALPCQLPESSESPSPTDQPSGELADFPLDTGYPETHGSDGSPVKVTNKPGVGVVEICGEIAWDPAAGTKDVIGTEYVGEAEDFRGRTLALYESVDAAAAAVASAKSVVADCSVETSDDESGAESLFEIQDSTSSVDQRWLIFTQRYRTPEGFTDTGLTVYHLVQVGEMVFASYEYGEGGGSPETIANAIARSTEQAEAIVELMSSELEAVGE